MIGYNSQRMTKAPMFRLIFLTRYASYFKWASAHFNAAALFTLIWRRSCWLRGVFKTFSRLAAYRSRKVSTHGAAAATAASSCRFDISLPEARYLQPAKEALSPRFRRLIIETTFARYGYEAAICIFSATLPLLFMSRTRMISCVEGYFLLPTDAILRTPYHALGLLDYAMLQR